MRKKIVAIDKIDMASTRPENRKLSAWIGSIFFHSVLSLLALLWFSFSSAPTREAPERIAIGNILLQSSGGGGQQTEAPQNESPTSDSDSAMVELEQFSVNLSILPTVNALSPGSEQTVSQPNTVSATDLTTALQSGVSAGPGIGDQTGVATVSVFGSEGKGTRFMYVFDRSESMEGIQLRAAKAELIRSLDPLDSRHQFNIMFFNQSMHRWRPSERGRQLVSATEANKHDAVRFVSGMTAEGGTQSLEPLLEAIAYRPDVIFFLTDGESITPAQLRDIERTNSRLGRSVQINVIEFGDGGFTDRPSRLLQQLAQENHGQYRNVNASALP